MELTIPPQAAFDILTAAPETKFSLAGQGSTTRSPASAENIREAAREFEAFFISYLFKVMRETVPNGLLENKAGQMFYSFYDQELGRLAAQAGGIGLGAMVEGYIEHQYPVTGKILLKVSSSPTDKSVDEAGNPQSRVVQSSPPASQQGRR